MINDIKAIKRKGTHYLIFNKKGTLVRLTKKEHGLFRKYKDDKAFPKKHKCFFNRLCHYGLLKFENYNPAPVQKKYCNSLYNANSTKPVHTAPILAHLAITNKCNMKCKYCSVRKANAKTRDLSTKQWKRIIKKVADFGTFQIGFTGGEPTLRKDIVKLTRYVDKLGCTANMTTNGNLSEELIKKLAKAGMPQCQVSLDSHKAITNDRMRGKGAWERAVRTINLLNKNRVCAGIDCVVSKNNIKDIPAFIKWVTKKKVPYLTLIKLKKGDLPLEVFKKLVPSYEEYSRLIEFVCSRQNKDPNVTIDCGSVSNLQYTLRDDEKKKIPTAGCPIGHTLIAVLPNGDVYPCAALLDPQFKLGNLLKDSMGKIWFRNSTLKQLRLIKKKVEGHCKDCDRLGFCRGGCRGIAHTLTGNLWASDPTCTREVEKNGHLSRCTPGRALCLS